MIRWSKENIARQNDSQEIEKLKNIRILRHRTRGFDMRQRMSVRQLRYPNQNLDPALIVETFHVLANRVKNKKKKRTQKNR